MKPVGLLGCGNIARIIASEMASLNCVAVYDIDAGSAARLAGMTGAIACAGLDDFLDRDFSLVVEAASVDALWQHGESIVSRGKDLLALSAGAFLESGFRERLIRAARRHGARIQVPSGAMFGLDNLRIGRISAIDSVLLRTTKPPQALASDVAARTCLYRGSAVDAVRRYPRNVNVAAALSLAAGMEVEVELWVDPHATGNTHEVVVTGRFGEACIRIDNRPSPDNPRTSYLAALSVMAVLGAEDEPFRVGS